jgi:hypothetical protein
LRRCWRDCAVNCLIAFDLVGGIADNSVGAGSGRTKTDLQLKGSIVQGAGVLDPDHTGGVTDCGEGFVGDLNGLWVAVDQIESVEELLAGVFLRGKDREHEFQKLTGAILGRLHLGSGCHANIPAGRLGFRSDARCYLTGVKV